MSTETEKPGRAEGIGPEKATKEHAEFCEANFARAVARNVIEWKLAGKPNKR